MNLAFSTLLRSSLCLAYLYLAGSVNPAFAQGESCNSTNLKKIDCKNFKLEPGVKYKLNCSAEITSDYELPAGTQISVCADGEVKFKGKFSSKATTAVFSFPDLQSAIENLPEPQKEMTERWGVYPGNLKGGKVQFLNSKQVVRPEWFGAVPLETYSGKAQDSADAFRLAIASLPNGGEITPLSKPGSKGPSLFFKVESNLVITQNNLTIDLNQMALHSTSVKSPRIWCTGDYLGAVARTPNKKRWSQAIQNCVIKNGYFGAKRPSNRDARSKHWTQNFSNTFKGPHFSWCVGCQGTDLVKTGSTLTSFNMFTCKDCKFERIFNNEAKSRKKDGVAAGGAMGLNLHRTDNVVVRNFNVNVDPENIEQAWDPSTENSFSIAIQPKGGVDGKIENVRVYSMGGNASGEAKALMSRGDSPWEYVSGSFEEALEVQLEGFRNIPHSYAYDGDLWGAPKLCKEHAPALKKLAACKKKGDCSVDGVEYNLSPDNMRALKRLTFLLYGDSDLTTPEPDSDPELSAERLGNWCKAPILSQESGSKIVSYLDIFRWAFPDPERATHGLQISGVTVKDVKPPKSNEGLAVKIVDSFDVHISKVKVSDAHIGIQVIRSRSGHEEDIVLDLAKDSSFSSIERAGIHIVNQSQTLTSPVAKLHGTFQLDSSPNADPILCVKKNKSSESPLTMADGAILSKASHCN